LTRAETAVFLVRAKLGLNPFSFANRSAFSDVPASRPDFPYIQKLFDLAVTRGCGVQSYCPDAEASRQEFAVLLMRALFDETLP
jgi:hypothetical protein